MGIDKKTAATTAEQTSTPVPRVGGDTLNTNSVDSKNSPDLTVKAAPASEGVDTPEFFRLLAAFHDVPSDGESWSPDEKAFIAHIDGLLAQQREAGRRSQMARIRHLEYERDQARAAFHTMWDAFPEKSDEFAALATRQPVAPELTKLKSAVMRAANQWATAEHDSAKSVGRGGPELDKRCEGAELKVYKAVGALAAAIGTPSPVALVSAQLTRYAPGGLWRENPVMDRDDSGEYVRLDDVAALLAASPKVAVVEPSDTFEKVKFRFFKHLSCADRRMFLRTLSGFDDDTMAEMRNHSDELRLLKYVFGLAKVEQVSDGKRDAEKGGA